MAAHFPVQLSDLRRLLRLFRDRDRSCVAVRLSAADKFQSSIYFHLVFRILDAVEHFAVNLVTDLSLRSAWWQSPWDLDNLSELNDRDETWCYVARRRPRLSVVGTV